jgi:hypothetical protein
MTGTDTDKLFPYGFTQDVVPFIQILALLITILSISIMVIVNIELAKTYVKRDLVARTVGWLIVISIFLISFYGISIIINFSLTLGLFLFVDWLCLAIFCGRFYALHYKVARKKGIIRKKNVKYKKRKKIDLEAQYNPDSEKYIQSCVNTKDEDREIWKKIVKKKQRKKAEKEAQKHNTTT